MAKKKKSTQSHETRTAENYYELKTDAVERLVNADKKTYPKTKKDPGKEYRSSWIDKIPSWILAVFVKFWFAGAVCFFIFWGLGLYITDIVDMIVVIGIVLGMVTDILVNNIYRFFETYKGQNSKWMMFPQKKYWTFLANIPYNMLILAVVIEIYEIINALANVAAGTTDVIVLGVEPILFGIFYMLTDLCFITIKNTSIRIFQDAKEKNGK
ncbi:MAG: hypothetical protein J6K75_09885 [Erysipelotrichaceae bacterium]|nr:hypothetical protein [Erysipelotrichaceae bacterium]